MKTNAMDNTITMTYDALNKQVKEILAAEGQKNKLTFSMFETVVWPKDDGAWMVKVPDLTSKKPIFKGKVRFIAPWEEYRGLHAIKNPTWKDALLEANAAAVGDHHFLESIEFKEKDNEIVAEMFFGS